MNILVVGGGGREHAISWALAKSCRVTHVFCVPGNGGMQNESKCRVIKPKDGESIEDAALRVAVQENCVFAVVGPEDPLAKGLADSLRARGIAAVGPGKEGAVLEASKDFAKQFMARHGVRCAESVTFDNALDAHEYIRTHAAPIVVKADGLAAGKGVVVALDKNSAHDAVTQFMEQGTLGSAGAKLVIEEFLDGVEYSVLAAVCVTKETIARGTSCIKPFVSARDHKRLKTGNQGPNTGGMGAIAPVPDVTDTVFADFTCTILEPTLKGLIRDGIEYQGFIFFGVMCTKDGSKLLEYNVRLGDPETQAVLPLMQSDFVELCEAILDQSLVSFSLEWKKGAVCAPVLVSGGYPVAYKKGFAIVIDEKLMQARDVKIFISGGEIAAAVSVEAASSPSAQQGKLVTSGGRVLTVSAFAPQADTAWERAYNAIGGISFDKMYYRTDIGRL